MPRRRARAAPRGSPARAGPGPCSPATGSTITAARLVAVRSNAASQPRRRRCTAATIVSAGARRAARPGPGRPSVATPEPACDEERVGVAVVAALELDDPVAAGRAAREPHRGHRRLGAGGHQPHLLDRRARASTIASASSTSRSVGAPNVVPSRRGLAAPPRRRRVGVAEDRAAPTTACSRCSGGRPCPRGTAPCAAARRRTARRRRRRTRAPAS